MIDTAYILNTVIQVYKNYNIRYFPIDCFSLLKKQGYTVFSYQQLNQQNPLILEFCDGYSSEAFIDGNNKIVAYNEKKNFQRVRFSLMHELGHIVLNHRGEQKIYEQEANFFASNILAPRMVIHYANCKNAQDVSTLFQLSLQASDIAFNDYRKWQRMIAYKWSYQDKQMYEHFYNEKENVFVYQAKLCPTCGREIQDRQYEECLSCRLFTKPISSDTVESFLKLEQSWLYGDCY